MRKIFFLYFPAALLLALTLLVRSPFAAEGQPESGRVQLRIAKHADYFRIVFTADDAIVQKAVLAQSKNSTIRVEFGRTVLIELNRKNADGNPIRLDPAEKRPLEYMKGIFVTAGPQSCSINMESPTETKILKLTSPARLVIDASFSKNDAAQKKEPAPVVEESTIPTNALIIDAGHGGEDKGIHSQSTSEKEITLGIARDITAAVGKKSRTIILTRKGDQSVSLDDRVKIAMGQKGALYISIHTGAGREVVVYTAAKNAYAERSESLAQSIAASLGKELHTPGRFDRLHGLYIAAVPGPSVLIELPSPLLVLYDKKMRDRVVKGIVNGLSVLAKDDAEAAKPQRSAPQQQPQQPLKKKLTDEI